MAFTDYSFQAIFTQGDTSSTTVQVTDLPSGQRPTVGTRKYQKDPAETASWRKLVYAKLDAAGAAVANDLVYWTNAAHTIVSVDDGASTSGLNGVAGVAIGAVAASAYGWFLTYGAATLNLQAAVNASAGDVLIGSTSGKLVNKVTIATAPTHKPVGIATANASGAGGTVAAWVEIEY